MAFPTPVNNQITDAATQTNVKVPAEAPAIAMGNLYQATAQALSNAAHNATNAQQQTSVTAQAATTMGVATLYSIDTASDPVMKPILTAAVAPKTLAAVAEPDTAGQGTANVVAANFVAADAAVAASTDEAHGTVSSQIKDAIEFLNKVNIGGAEAWAHACKEVMEAVAVSLHALNKVERTNNLEILRQAAYCAALAQVIKAPEQFEQYQKIIELIKSL